MGADIKRQGDETIAALVVLRRGAAGELDFDHAARTHGSRVLQEPYGSGVSTATIDELVAAVIDILGKVVRSEAN